jgi:RNA polymerase sigma-70 factor (ECF subfamily)
MNAARRALRRRLQPPELEAAPAMAEESLDLQQAIRRLPVRQQEAVVLYYGLDLTLDDVASAMGCRPGTVKAHLARARAALGEALAEDSIER